ncbi:MAG: NAD(P)-dependent oxidoreductase [Flavobacteriales bacterium]|jgi:putative NADH-flavin reductase
MKVVVFGAAGRTGFEVVRRALEKGHKVKAVVRNLAQISLIHPNLEVVSGDALSQDSVSKAVEGQDAVVSCLSSAELSHRQVFIHHIINAMRLHKVRRVIAIGGIGALQASEHLKVYETTTFPREYVDITQAHIRVLDALLTSRLDFTFVCPPQIKEGERTGGYKTQDGYPTQGWSITTGDLADFMVSELQSNQFVGKKVGISNS